MSAPTGMLTSLRDGLRKPKYAVTKPGDLETHSSQGTMPSEGENAQKKYRRGQQPPRAWKRASFELRTIHSDVKHTTIDERGTSKGVKEGFTHWKGFLGRKRTSLQWRK